MILGGVERGVFALRYGIGLIGVSCLEGGLLERGWIA